MDISLKQRLAGAVVIIALGVIFIPLLLDGAGMEEYRRLKMNMPERPEYEFPVVVPEKPMPPAPERTAKAPEGEHIQAPARTRTRAGSSTPRSGGRARATATPPAPKPKATPKPARHIKPAFVVQLASFEKRDNARALVDRLRKAGFESFIETHRLDGRRMYRVKVGPMLRREDANKVLARLERKFRLKGTIQNWHPADTQ